MLDGLHLIVDADRDGAPVSGETNVASLRSRRDAAFKWLVVAGGVSFVVVFFVIVFGRDIQPPTSAGADAHSTSAIGYRGLAELLKASGIPTVVSRTSLAEEPTAGWIHFLLEPYLETEDERLRYVYTVNTVAESGGTIVLVLWKWRGAADPKKREWVAAVKERTIEDVERRLGIALFDTTLAGVITRPEPPLSDPTGDVWAGRRPILEHPQLLPLHGGEADVLSMKEGALIVRWSRNFYVISDPDLLNNAGLGDGDNAAIVRSFLTDVCLADRIFFDETVHGSVHPPSIWVDLLDFPLVLVTLHFIGLMVLVVWIMLARFGKPDAAPPRLSPGKEALIESTADLLTLAGSAGASLRRYFRLALETAARSFGLPPQLTDEERVKKLDLIAGRRSARKAAELQDAVDRLENVEDGTAQILTAAREIHAWRRDLLL